MQVTGLPNGSALMSDLEANPGSRWRLVVFELEGLQASYDAFGNSAGDALVSKIAGRIADLVTGLDGAAYRIDPIRFAVLVPADGRTSGEILLAASSPLQDEGDSEHLIGRSFGEVTIPDDAADPETALQIAGQRVAANKQRQQRSARRQAHAVLMAVLDARRPELRAHLRNVAYRSISLSRRLGLGLDAIDDIFLAAELQDIGLLTVPESILEKESSLTTEEAALIRRHPEAGERIIASALRPGIGRCPGSRDLGALRRSWLPRWPDRRRDPARRQDHRRLRRLRGDGRRPALPAGPRRGRGRGRAGTLRRQPVRSRRGRCAGRRTCRGERRADSALLPPPRRWAKLSRCRSPPRRSPCRAPPAPSDRRAARPCRGPRSAVS